MEITFSLPYDLTLEESVKVDKAQYAIFTAALLLKDVEQYYIELESARNTGLDELAIVYLSAVFHKAWRRSRDRGDGLKEFASLPVRLGREHYRIRLIIERDYAPE